MMMQMEILEEFSGSNDHAIVKGKRTKRPRPSSSASSSGGGSGGGGVEVHNSLLFSYSPTTSSGISTSTEEDEDMANCLILLARGGSPPPIKAVEGKFSSRKFADMATTAAGKVGIYVYECKTCNRTFPSFQALGGHRASHKKPKPTTDDDQKKSPPAPPPPPPDYQEEEEAPPPSTQLPNNKSCHNYDPNKPKIHECSICGSEFASGQALGGHMRRHRTAPSTTGTRIGTSADNDSPTTSHDVSEKPRNTLEFDLNLPAESPEDDKLHDHEFPAPKQQPRLVFSAAALVDCHY